MTTTFETAKIGDKVWCMRSGWGMIKHMSFRVNYPICVVFENGAHETFRYDGKMHKNDVYPILFWDEIKFEIPTKSSQIDRYINHQTVIQGMTELEIDMEDFDKIYEVMHKL